MRKNHTNFDHFELVSEEFNILAEQIGFRNYKKPPFIAESTCGEWIAKMKIKKVILETETYAKKFKQKNCFIFYSNNYYLISKIQLILESAILHCKKLITKRITGNIVEILNENEICEIPEQLEFEKVVPVYVNKKIYLARTPNHFLNE